MGKKIPRVQAKAAVPEVKAAGRLGVPAPHLLTSIALLVPCFWQGRLQAGDLSSHLYNAWLAQLIERGQAPALSIAFQSTNVMFDLVLKALLGAIGAGAAQRIAVGMCVLIFAWGAFAFVSKVSGRAAWRMMPWIAVLAYGWVFHIGFFNFYLSLGFCLWALALAWNLETRGLAAAAGLLVAAYIAHALPVFWAIGVIGYLWLAPRIGLRLLGACLVGIALLRIALSAAMQTRWSAQQITLVSGLDQAWVFDSKYLTISILALAMCAVWLMRGIEMRRSLIFQVWLLTAVGIAILPGAVLIPGYRHLLAYIAERMSLPAAVCLLAWLGGAAARLWDRYVGIAAVGLFFVFLYGDESKLNALEDRIEMAVAQLPPMQRVISGIEPTGALRVNAVAHIVDRACLGRCYSYANYEPSTAQFRVRVNGENGIVAATYEDSYAMQRGSYVVKDRDLPLYQLLVDGDGNIQMRIPPAGQPCSVSAWNGF